MSGGHSINDEDNHVAFDDEMDTDVHQSDSSVNEKSEDSDVGLDDHRSANPEARKYISPLIVMGKLPLDIYGDLFFNGFLCALLRNKLELAEHLLALLICSRLISPKIVNNSFFNCLTNAYNPRFDVNYDVIKRHCLEVYKAEGKEIKETLKKLKGEINLSVQMSWYEERYGAEHHCMCLIAHFIDDNWKLRKLVLSFSYVWNGHNSPSTAIIKAVKEWEITNKVSSITAGNSYSDCDMVNLVAEEIKGKGILSGQLSHVCCCSDMISLLVQDGFKEISTIIHKVKELYWPKSAPLWFLASDALKKALELESQGEYSSDDTRSKYDVPSPEEWDKVRCVCRVVDRVYDIVKGLFDAKQPTSNIFLPHLVELRSYLIQESSGPDGFAKVMAAQMLQRFDKYWNCMRLVLSIASVFDPRYKMKYLEFSSCNADLVVASVLEAIHNLYKEYEVQNDTMPDQDQYLLTDSGSESDAEDKSSKRVKHQSLSSFDSLKLLQEYRQVVQPSNRPCKSELDLYLEEPELPWTHNFSVLKWWKAATFKYPNLSRMARDFLAIPLSVATSEDAYYTEPKEADARVASLEPELMNALMCTRSWFEKQKAMTLF